MPEQPNGDYNSGYEQKTDGIPQRKNAQVTCDHEELNDQKRQRTVQGADPDRDQFS